MMSSFNASIKRHGIVFMSLDAALAPEKPVDESANPAPARTEDTTGTIRIGLLASLTGANSEYGSFLQKGVRAGLAGIDSIDGRPLEIIVEDTRSDAVETVCAVRRLNDLGVLAIIGPEFSSSTITAAIESNAHGIPFIAPTATDRDLTRIGTAIFQLNFTPSAEATALADFAVATLGISKAVIIASRDAWGKEIADTFHAGDGEKKSGDRTHRIFHPRFGDGRSWRDHARYKGACSEAARITDSLVANITDALSDTAATDSTYYSSRTLSPIKTIDAVLISATSRDAVKIANKLVEFNIIATLSAIPVGMTNRSRMRESGLWKAHFSFSPRSTFRWNRIVIPPRSDVGRRSSDSSHEGLRCRDSARALYHEWRTGPSRARSPSGRHSGFPRFVILHHHRSPDAYEFNCGIRPHPERRFHPGPAGCARGR